METRRGTIANFRELVHPVHDAGLSRYESVFELGDQQVRFIGHEPASINNGDDVEVTGRIDRQFLLARHYTNHTRSIQGDGLKWHTRNQRMFWLIMPLVVFILLLVGGCYGLALLT